MKIFHIIIGHPLQFQGGVENYVRTLADLQSKLGHDVSVLAEHRTKINDAKYKIYTLNTEKLYRNLFGEMYDKKQYNIVKNILIEGAFDIIHVHLTLGLDWNILNLIEQYHYVVSLHDYYFLCPRIQMIDKKRRICEKYSSDKCKHCVNYLERYQVYRIGERFINQIVKSKTIRIYLKQKATEKRYYIHKKFLENANVLLPVSEKVKEVFLNSNINGNYKVLHIGNITADSFEKINKIYNNQHINIAMLGTLSYMKGADIFCRIANETNNPLLKFMFWGNSATYKEQLKIYNIVDYGPYRQSELTDILKDVHLGLVLPVWQDNAPQVVMEFLNNKIPVIATSMGGITDFINERNGYLFDPFDEIEFKKLIDFINSLTMIKIQKMADSIKRTKTPLEHAMELIDIYSLEE